VADDLDLLELVAEQSAIALDYVTLLAKQKAVSAQLQASNQELAAFAYSVSHDLRAPLRAIDGFSQALLEDCAEQLDDQGKVYLRRVRANVQHMGELIDALLTLSRLTRVEMNRESVDLSALVRDIAAELQKREAQRQVEFVIEDDLLVDGDPGLLQVALENLLDNAWKFSSKRPQARIEFRVMDHEGQTAYFVRDDGAGFDMAYADKLFGAFQRLHSMNDFSGTGIGLATVQRVIHRHGGQLWAEAAPNQGATFYFTL
jgi:light-regulated signal transduction histidine kinase (bacteriophytochrome)